jgi:hypothetical protein
MVPSYHYPTSFRQSSLPGSDLSRSLTLVFPDSTTSCRILPTKPGAPELTATAATPAPGVGATGMPPEVRTEPAVLGRTVTSGGETAASSGFAAEMVSNVDRSTVRMWVVDMRGEEGRAWDRQSRWAVAKARSGRYSANELELGQHCAAERCRGGDVLWQGAADFRLW